MPDSEHVLDWRQIYHLTEVPRQLIVVGSGVTGAEFASAYQALGSQVMLVSSRQRVLPHEDEDAAVVLEDVFRRRGMTVLSRSRAAAVKRSGDGVVATLEDARRGGDAAAAQPRRRQAARRLTQSPASVC